MATIAATIQAGGATAAIVRQGAMAVVAGLEGARTLAQARRSNAPFDAIVEQFSQSARRWITSPGPRPVHFSGPGNNPQGPISAGDALARPQPPTPRA